MAWWSKLFGDKPPRPAPPPAGMFPTTVPLIPDQLSATVNCHDIPAGREPIPCWTYVTRGLWDVGQKEIIFSLRRNAGEAPEAYPHDPLKFFTQVHQLASQGRLVDAGGHTCFRAGTGFLGSTELIGLAYLAAEPLAGLELPPPDRALTAVLLTSDEAEIVQTIGSYRVTALLGRATRYYPCPPWSERGRASVLTLQDMDQSLLSRMPLAYYAGATARMLMPPQQPAPPGVDRVAAQGTRICLRLPASQPAGFRDAVAGLADAWTLALLTSPDPEADVRLVWQPGQQETHTITPNTSLASCMTGGFLALVAEGSLPDGGRILEDGFLITLSPATQRQVKDALLSCQPLVVTPTAPGLTEFALDWRGVAAQPVTVS